MSKTKILIEVSSRHLHIAKEDFTKLFGKNARLSVRNFLAQKTQFASEQTVDLQTKKGLIKNVRILGPFRSQTQIEISRTDAIKLGLNPPLRESGNLKGSEGVFIFGPKAKIWLKQGVIIALRHIHVDPKSARNYGLKEGQKVAVKIKGPRALIFENVLVRIKPEYTWRMQVDTDEGNAAGIKGKIWGELFG